MTQSPTFLSLVAPRTTQLTWPSHPALPQARAGCSWKAAASCGVRARKVSPAGEAVHYPSAGITKFPGQSLRASQRLSRSTCSLGVIRDPWTHLCQQERHLQDKGADSVTNQGSQQPRHVLTPHCPSAGQGSLMGQKQWALSPITKPVPGQSPQQGSGVICQSPPQGLR